MFPGRLRRASLCALALPALLAVVPSATGAGTQTVSGTVASSTALDLTAPDQPVAAATGVAASVTREVRGGVLIVTVIPR